MSLIEKAAAKLKKSESLIEKSARKEAEKASKPSTVADEKVSQPAMENDVFKAEPVIEKPQRRSRTVEIDPEVLEKHNILTATDENSIIAEEFRIVKRSLLLNAFSKGDQAISNGNIIMVSSTQPNEGKTFCAISLAMSMAAERDLTVLLVDADVAKPDVLNTLELDSKKGLIDAIEDDSIDLSDCLLKTNIRNLSILPAGKKHNLTTELLASERMGMMIDEIAKRYHDRVIIIDSPPVLASSAASVLALHCGQVLFVVEAEKTREPELKEALSMIDSCDNVSLLLNKARFTGGKKKFGSYYGYGYNQ